MKKMLTTIIKVIVVSFATLGFISSAVAGNGLSGSYGGASNNDRTNKLYFFETDHYWRWNIETDKLDGGYPNAIQAGWSNIPNNLDAATYAGSSKSNRDNKIYLFKGNSYWRWNITTDTMDSGYPKSINAGWPGLPNDLDAAVYAGSSESGRNNKLYFFKDSQYWRWDIEKDQLDSGYPKSINAGWSGLPNNLDSAIYGGYSNGSRDNKLYFFKGCSYWRWNIQTDTLDKGYPADVKQGWKGLHCG